MTSRRYTTEQEVKLASEIIVDRVKVLRAMSPFITEDEDEELEVSWKNIKNHGSKSS